MTSNKDIDLAWHLITDFLTDNVPLPSEGRYNNFEDWYPELDEARLLIHEHLERVWQKEKHNEL